jgi:F0F1-type ATP synthase assembly protein I
MHDRVILLKLLMALAGALVCVVLWRLPWVRRLSNGQFTAMTIGLLVGGRLGFYTLVYLVQGQPVPTDVPTYYYPEAVKTLSGLLPYRDFASSYAPLFDYLGAAMIYLWNDTRVYVLTAIAADVLAMPIWLAVGRRLFAENVVRTAAILYVTNVKALLSVCTGQNQIWIALLLAAAWWLRLRGRPFWSGMMLGLGLSAVKVLVLILTPPVWLAGGRRLMWLVGFAAIPAVVYLGFIALGADVLLPLKNEGGLVTCGNLPFLATLAGLDPAGWIGAMGIACRLAIWAGLYLAVWRRGLDPKSNDIDLSRMIHVLTLALLCFMLLSKKAYTGYLVLGMFCMCLTLADRPFSWRDMLIYCLFMVATVMEPTLWDSWLPNQDLRLFHQAASEGHPGFGRLTVFASVEVVLLGCYLRYAVQAFRSVFPDAVKTKHLAGSIPVGR